MILDGLTSEQCISSLEEIKEQYKILTDIEEKKYTNIHDQTDTCFRLSKKALPKYYVYEYDPKKTLDPETILFLESLNVKLDEKIYKDIDVENWNNIEYLSNKLNEILDIAFNKYDTIKDYQKTIDKDIDDLLDEIRNKNVKTNRNIPIFDLTPKYSCCNCISIILYYQEWSETDNLDRLLNTYLYSMKKTLDIVSNNLDMFVVRYYIHTSVFDVIKIKEDDDFREFNMRVECENILLYLLNHPQSEVFIYSCEKIIGDFHDTNLSKIRINRFIHDDINILVSREADGIVSISDCNNIKLFMNDAKKIIMTYNFAKSFNLGFSVYNRRYNKTLISFNNLEDFAYEKPFTQQQYIDFLAGVFSTKIKFNLEYIWNTVKEFNKMLILSWLMKNSYNHIEQFKKIIFESDVKQHYFNQFFDEINLNNILKPINNNENLSKYCVLIDKNRLGRSLDNKSFVVTYTRDGKKIEHVINTEEVICPNIDFLISCIDVSLRDFNNTLYSNLPILLINKAFKYDERETYDKIYPPSTSIYPKTIESEIDHGIKRRRSKRKSKRLSKRNVKFLN